MREDHDVPYIQHDRSLVAEESVGNINVPTSPSHSPSRNPPTVPQLCTLLRLCGRGRQRNLRPPIFLTRSNERCFDFPHRQFLSTEYAMEILDPSKQAHLYDSFHVVANDIAKGISASRSVAANGHWKKWAKFFYLCGPQPPTRLVPGSSTYPQFFFKEIPDRIPHPQRTSSTILQG